MTQSSNGESGKHGDPRLEREIELDKTVKVVQDRSVVDYQDMEYKTDSSIIERKKNNSSKEMSREGIGQDSSCKTSEDSDENKTKMTKVN